MQTGRYRETGAGLAGVLLVALAPPAVVAGRASGQGTASLERPQEVPRVVVGPNVQVSAARASAPHVEPHVAADPGDPDRLLVASIVIDDQGGWRCASYVSDDGGSGWRPSSGGALEDLGDCGDPWVAFGPAGRAYFSGLHADTTGGGRVERIVVLRSNDRGATWTGRSEVPHGPGDRGGFDHPTMVVDATGGPHAGTVYIAAAQSVEGPSEGLHNSHPISLSVRPARATDFTPPLRTLPSDLVHMTGVPVVLADGGLAFTFCDFATPDHERLLRVRRLWVVRSRDGGRSLSPPSFVAESSGYWECANLATDGERLYSAWANTVTLGPAEPAIADVALADHLVAGVFMVRSDDGGQSWSAPLSVRSSSDRPEARHPVVAAGPGGVVAVAWMEATEPDCFEPFVAISTDRGDSFSGPARLSDVDPCVPPRSPGNVRGSFEVAERWPAGGDYFGLVHRGGGEFVAVWSDSRGGTFQIWSASVRAAAERR